MSLALLLRRQLRLRHVNSSLLRARSTISTRCRRFTVLALESSADDTCAAVVTSERKILSNIVLKQLGKHEAFGGIEPYTAIQEHQRNMPLAVRQALEQANLEVSRVDGIAFTRGPGMSGCLSVCANAAKTLASALQKPLIGVHHLQAHALTTLLTCSNPPVFPFLTLLISGGHTMLVLALSHTRFRILASTRDEAVGRTIDKVTRDLKLEWKGRAPGAALEAFCQDEDGEAERAAGHLPEIKPFVIPLRGKLEFSFSGLHSSVDRFIEQHGFAPMKASSDSPNPLSRKAKHDLPLGHKLAVARAFQDAAFNQLIDKVLMALAWCEKHSHELAVEHSCHTPPSIRHLVVSGGVASNSTFREKLAARLKEESLPQRVSAIFPPASLCTDNAAMIAWASMHRFQAGESDPYSIDHRAVWSIEHTG